MRQGYTGCRPPHSPWERPYPYPGPLYPRPRHWDDY